MLNLVSISFLKPVLLKALVLILSLALDVFGGNLAASEKKLFWALPSFTGETTF